MALVALAQQAFTCIVASQLIENSDAAHLVPVPEATASSMDLNFLSICPCSLRVLETGFGGRHNPDPNYTGRFKDIYKDIITGFPGRHYATLNPKPYAHYDCRGVFASPEARLVPAEGVDLSGHLDEGYGFGFRPFGFKVGLRLVGLKFEGLGSPNPKP